MTDIIRTRQRSRSGAISSSDRDPTSRLNQHNPHPPPSTSTSTSSSSPFASLSTIQNTMAGSHFPRSSSDLYSPTHSSNQSSISSTGHSSSTSSVPYSSHLDTQQSRPPMATLRPGSGTGGGAVTRTRSGSNPPMYRDPGMGADALYTQRRAYRESTNSTVTGSGSQGGANLHPRSFLGETGERHRASPGPSVTGAFRGGEGSSPGTRARAATSSGYSGLDQGSTVAGVISNLSERSSYFAPLTRERSSGSTVSGQSSTTVHTTSKLPSPAPRTHSHSVSVPSVYSSRISSQSPPPPTPSMTTSTSLSKVSTPPTPRYSTKPPMPVSSTAPTSSSSGVSTATSASTSSAATSGAQSNAPLPVASAVDLVGKRLREQQLQDRFKAAQGFIERTVGKALPSSDLHESLKDGVILCRLANRLRPGTVEQISLKNLPFVKMENISNFLNAARQLGVQSSDLFQTVDLYEGKDMTQVVSTILTLERVVGGVARMVAKDKRPGPSPLFTAGSTPSQIPKAGINGAPAITRMRSKTAHTPSVASTTASIRPSSSSFYAAQVRKLEEESIRFATGYDRLESTLCRPKDPRHQSTPVISRATPPPIRDKIPRLPSLEDIEAAVEDMSFGIDENDPGQLEAMLRREQRDLVFGNNSSLTFEQSSSIPKSLSGPLLSVEGKTSAIDVTRRRKKSISLDPQAANAVMGSPGYRDGFASPGSPGVLTQSVSYNAISNLNSAGIIGTNNQLINLKQHTRYPSERNSDGTVSRSILGSPASSRSTTPVQGLRKSANSVEPLREKLELWENEVSVATYHLGNCIGRGQFGSVYKALNMVTGQMVAVKRIKIDGLKDEERDMLMQEVDLLKSLAHPSIVKYEGFIKTEGYLNIILEFAENGSLLTTLKSFGTFPEKLVVAYVVKILEGLVYLHGKEVVHCDLKAANILTTKNGNVKLSDFGVSLNLKVKESDFGAVAGTPNWMAPEVIELKGASPASDIWSLGCTIIEMLTGRPPYADLLAMTTLFRIVEDERPPLPSDLSMDLLDFLCQCFQKDPTLRPSAGALGRHVWIKRNFASRELKPMDSLPYMKRKLLEPKEKIKVIAAEESNGTAARRALTPLGLSSGAPPPAASANGLVNGNGRGTRRGSVDSAGAGGYYASSTVPAPTSFPERYHEMNRSNSKAASQHQFVKSSFAKPVECRLCHESVRKQAVICQDCSMVFHRKCQFYVGNTCFPGPHLSYFQTPSPAQSVPNLKMLANGKPPGSSRPNSRASLLNLDDRSRSVTPSQGLSSRACPTPPLSAFAKRETTTIKEGTEQQRRVVSPLPPLTPGHRAMSPEGHPPHMDSHQTLGQRPPSRQSESPTSPTFSGLRNFIAGPRRFSFGKKGATSSASHPLPTPPTSFSSHSLAHVARQQAGTPDSGKVLRQMPTTPPKTLPVPIMSGNNSKSGGSAGHTYRGREFLPGGPLGPLDSFDDDHSIINNHSNNYGHSHQSQRHSSISMFSTSAPPVHGDYVSGRSSVASTKYGSHNDDHDEEDDDSESEDDDDGHEDINDMDEQDLEALIIPSVVRTPRSSIDAGDPVVVTNGGGHYRVKSQSFGQTLSQQPQNQSAPLTGHSNPSLYDATPKLSAAFSFGALSSTRPSHQQHPSSQQIQQQQQQNYHSGRTQLNNGYNSSGSSSAAMTSSYSSQSNNSSSASSLGSVAALLEEEERMMKEQHQQHHHHQAHHHASGVGHSKNGMLGVPSSAYHLATQPPQANHVGIRTMLSRFSASSSKDQSNINNVMGSTNSIGDGHSGGAQDKDKDKDGRQATKASTAYAAAARHQIQAPTQYQQQHSQHLAGVRSIHPLQNQHVSSVGDREQGGHKIEFAQGYDRQSMSNSNHNDSHHHLHGYGAGFTNGGSLQNGNGGSHTPAAWRASSPSGGIHSSHLGIPSMSNSSQQSFVNNYGNSHATSNAALAAAAAASALKRGGKVIRRSMGATLEKERWD